MTNLPEFYRDNCLFQLYLENKVHAVHHGEIVNTLVDRPVNPNSISGFGEEQRKFLMIKDVPDYLKFSHTIPKDSGIIRVPQYYGYLVNLKGYTNIGDFLKEQLSKRNIKNLYSKKRKLDGLGDIEYRVLTGPLEESVYEDIFTNFKQLLVDRFDQKKILNRDLFHWQELYGHCYLRLVNKKALLFVIYKANKPICIALNYVLDHSMFSHIQTYDVAYSTYNMGDISMLFQLEWCLTNNMPIFDVSKGSNPYKEKWCNHRYRLYYEIIYPKDSTISVFKANLLIAKLKLKQKLRDMGLLGNIINMDKWLYLKHGRKLKGTISK